MNRTYLFVPGNRPERYAKALAAGADAVIIDLEDAVAPAEKTAARDALRAWLSPAHPVLVRINSADTAWFEDDLALAGLPGVTDDFAEPAWKLAERRIRRRSRRRGAGLRRCRGGRPGSWRTARSTGPRRRP